MFARGRSLLLAAVLALHPHHALAAPGRAELQTNAVVATNALMAWYNRTNGLWESTSWWNSANCITTLALLTEINPHVDTVTAKIWNNTFENAQKFNLHQERASPDGIGPSNTSTPGQHEPRIRSFNNHNTYHKRPVRAVEKRAIVEEWVQETKGFLNGFYDDEGWWALAWMKVFDYSEDKAHLDTAVDIFDDMLSTGYNATCGGIWWNKKRMYNAAISNELFISTAAHLANRAENKPYYLKWAQNSWDWFQKSGLINKDGNINDGLDINTCQNNGDVIWSYNQGVILGALVELAKADPKNATNYLDAAKNIALAAKTKLADKDGILHEHHEPDLGNDGYQFKGVLMRNLRVLYDATKEEWMRDFLIKNAQVVWESARNTTSNLMGPVWSGPYLSDFPATAATQSSALDVLVAAAAVA